MEYKIFHNLRNKVRIPYLVRFFLAILAVLIGIIGIFIPIIPGIIFFIAGIVLLIPADKIRHLVKIRKGLFYMLQNLHERRVIRHKVLDIIIHSKDLIGIRKK
nr:hypothetical protein [Candidatus Gracilibacteria bacterium]